MWDDCEGKVVNFSDVCTEGLCSQTKTAVNLCLCYHSIIPIVPKWYLRMFFFSIFPLKIILLIFITFS